MTDDRAHIEIERLRATDDELGADAAAAWNAITAGEGIDGITQERLQYFLWYELPHKWLGPPDTQERVAHAAGRLLEALGLTRYAEICRSETTTRVHAACLESRDAGLRAYTAASEQSGIEPPDLEDFAWGGVMGSEESDARTAVSVALEAAIVDGELTPGGPRWRIRAREVAAAALDSAHLDLVGQSLRTAVTTERISWWIDGAGLRSREVAKLRSRVADRLLNPVPPPTDIGDSLAPLLWLLEGASNGLRLTSAGYLPRLFVVEGTERWGWAEWWLAEAGREPRSESEVLALQVLHQFSRDAGLLYRRSGVARLTRRGQAALAEPERAWRAVVEHFPGPSEWQQAACELAALVLVDRPAILEDELWESVAAMAADMGWRTGEDGVLPDRRDALAGLRDGHHLLEALGIIERDRARRRSRITVGPVGRAAYLAYLRSRAAGPRFDVWV